MAITSSYLYWTTASYLRDEAHRFLSERVLALQVKSGNADAIKNLVEIEWPKRFSEKLIIEIKDSHGNSLARTANENGTIFSALNHGPATEYPHFHFLNQDDVGSYLITTVRLGSNLTAVLALDMEHDHNLLVRYQLHLGVVVFITFVLSLIIGRYVARSSLLPLRQFNLLAERTRFDQLNERIQTQLIPPELIPLADQVNAMLERLESGAKRLTRFSSDIAHELRTPLNNIRGEIEVSLTRPREKPEYIDVMSSILEETDRLNRLIEIFLFLARTDNPTNTISCQKILLQSELDKIYDFFSVSMSEVGIQFHASLPDDISIAGDPLLFGRAISNLIANAITHLTRGGSLKVSAQREDAFIHIKITDSGTGIPAAHLNQIFDRFYRVDPARQTTQLGGFGLGLTIVKTIVEAHKGTVGIESVVGSGTTVLLKWPAWIG